MKAGEVKFRELLGGNIQYLVPLFQRPYASGIEQWAQLWTDIDEIYEAADDQATHFTGAIVTLPLPDAPEKAAKFILIDGQQRLTTLLILLRVLAREAERATDDFLMRQVTEGFLKNLTRRPEEQYKLVPTQRDRQAFQELMSGHSLNGNTQIHEAAKFFEERLRDGAPDGAPYDIERLVNTITSRLELVSIRLEQDDSPYRIFESLNNKGMPLSATDLIRNHIFMRMADAPAQQEHVYATLWRPMEEILDSDLTGFFWRVLMMDGALPRWDAIFTNMRTCLENNKTRAALITFLEQLYHLASIYQAIVTPETHESSEAVRQKMVRLNRWELDTAYPYLLKVYSARQRGELTDVDCATILGHLESYAVRRFACGIPTNRLRSIFARAAAQFESTNAVAQCVVHLLANDWPTDEVFHERFVSFHAYTSSRTDRVRLILSSLEESFEHREPVSIGRNVTIEHIMPQTLTPAWEDTLGESFEKIHSRWLHTIGNLTLSGYNEQMGNRPYAEKRKILAGSHFELNRWLVDNQNWNEEVIQQRATNLAHRATEIWQRPGVP